MTIFASAVASTNDHGYEAGRYVANQVRAAFQTPPSVLVACISNQYPYGEVVRGIRSIIADIPLIGCRAPGVVSLAGLLTKGVTLLGLRLPPTDPPIALGLHSGLSSQPAQAVEQALKPLDSTLTSLNAAITDDLPDVLILADAQLSAMPAALARANELLKQRAVLMGGVTSHGSGVFVNDEVVSDGLAVGLLAGTAPTSSGMAASQTSSLTDLAYHAAEMAYEGQDGPLAAAFVVIGGSPPTDGEAREGKAREIDHIRTVLGHDVPLLGIYGAAAIAPVGNNVSQNAVQVYVIGQRS